MATKKKSTGTLWHIRAEGYGECRVVANNWEEATVEAAKWWGVPWRKVAAKCEELGRSTYIRGVCPSCSRIFNGPEVLCDLCRAGRRSCRELTAQRGREAAVQEIRRFYREERKKTSASEA